MEMDNKFEGESKKMQLEFISVIIDEDLSRKKIEELCNNGTIEPNEIKQNFPHYCQDL